MDPIVSEKPLVVHTFTDARTDKPDNTFPAALTTAELAAKIGCAQPDTHGLLQCLVKAGLAVKVGQRKAKSANGKGKPANLYSVDAKVLALFDTK